VPSALLNPFLLYLAVSSFFHYDYFTDGRAAWTSDQLVARPIPKHRTAQTHNKHLQTPNIHALCGIQTHDPSFRASEDSRYLRQLSYRNIDTVKKETSTAVANSWYEAMKWNGTFKSFAVYVSDTSFDHALLVFQCLIRWVLKRLLTLVIVEFLT
jgi:hypothetical protein